MWARDCLWRARCGFLSVAGTSVPAEAGSTGPAVPRQFPPRCPRLFGEIDHDRSGSAARPAVMGRGPLHEHLIVRNGLAEKSMVVQEALVEFDLPAFADFGFQDQMGDELIAGK